jgi:hypothetical protein
VNEYEKVPQMNQSLPCEHGAKCGECDSILNHASTCSHDANFKAGGQCTICGPGFKIEKSKPLSAEERAREIIRGQLLGTTLKEAEKFCLAQLVAYGEERVKEYIDSMAEYLAKEDMVMMKKYEQEGYRRGIEKAKTNCVWCLERTPKNDGHYCEHLERVWKQAIEEAAGEVEKSGSGSSVQELAERIRGLAK